MSEPIRPPFVAIPDADDPDVVWVNWCPLCGLGAAEHTEEKCAEKLRNWQPKGILAGLSDA